MKTIDFPSDHELLVNEPPLARLIPDDGLLIEHMQANIVRTVAFLSELPQEKLLYRYAEAKWTIKEIVSHLMDMERIYCYRMLCISRNEQADLPGFNDRQYVQHSGANDRPIAGLLCELDALRSSTLQFLDGLPADAFLKSGKVRGNQATVRALAYHIAGHEQHHIQAIKSKYL